MNIRFSRLKTCCALAALLLPLPALAQKAAGGASAASPNPAAGGNPGGGTSSTNSSGGQPVLYKCAPGSDGGGTLITDDPNDIKGRDCVRITPQRANTVPFPRPAAKADAGKAPNRVETGAQRGRDNDRRKILEEELASEQKRLGELRGEFNNGEPERRGDERNYQRYVDRVEKLKADIARSEANVDSLKREIGIARN